MPIKAIQEFLKMEAASGIILMIAALLAMIVANSALYPFYQALLDLPVVVAVGSFSIAKPLILWINDGLMAVFFFLVGLELKREFLEGDLSKPGQIALPAAGAIGGMLVPALCFVAFNYNDPDALNGWAIPTATDIAFALGILAIIGSKVPLQLKIFLTSLAIFDDLGAIIIIAIFYTEQLSVTSLTVSLTAIIALFLINRAKVTDTSIYISVGLVLWVAVLKSGVHATLAGVVLAFFIPLKGKAGEPSPLKSMEHNIHKVVAYVILPVFAFANAGINLTNIQMVDVLHPVPMGIMVGLFIGKQLGIFGCTFLAVKFGLATLPSTLNWRMIYGVSIIGGVGFTMSLFIGSLAFEQGNFVGQYQDKLGVIIGSLASGIMGYFVIKKAVAKL